MLEAPNHNWQFLRDIGEIIGFKEDRIVLGNPQSSDGTIPKVSWADIYWKSLKRQPEISLFRIGTRSVMVAFSSDPDTVWMTPVGKTFTTNNAEQQLNWQHLAHQFFPHNFPEYFDTVNLEGLNLPPIYGSTGFLRQKHSRQLSADMNFHPFSAVWETIHNKRLPFNPIYYEQHLLLTTEGEEQYLELLDIPPSQLNSDGFRRIVQYAHQNGLGASPILANFAPLKKAS